jgi:RNA polymerase sigma-70 factor, ECF subfamily
LERIDAESLFKVHASFIASFLLRLGVARVELDDMVQEVFLLAHRKGGYIPGPAKPRTWLCAIALRMARQGRRVESTRRVRLDEQAVLQAASEGGDPAHAFEMQESLSRVGLALESLDLEHRLAFLLYEVEGESCPEIAAVAGVPVGTIYSRLHHARRRFHAAYAELPAGPVLPPPPPLLPQPASGRESFPPLRLRGDAAAPDTLRGDLRRIAAIAVLDFDSAGGLQRLHDALATLPPPVAPSNTSSAGHSGHAAHAAQQAIPAGSMQPGAILRAAAHGLPGGRALLVIGASTVLLGVPDIDRSRRADPDAADTTGEQSAQASLSPRVRPLSRSPGAASRGNALRREIEELGRIHALVNVDPARAYRLTQSGDTQFKAGTMGQERTALAVLALWNSGQREDAVRKARTFIARYPHGPMRERILQLLREASP